jgi:hypothetical protein
LPATAISRRNDALRGCEAWRGPCERDRGRQGAEGSRVLEAGVFGLRRSLTRGRMLIKLRPAAPPDVVDRAHMPHPSRFASFARDEFPC